MGMMDDVNNLREKTALDDRALAELKKRKKMRQEEQTDSD
jgi:hypothetical protein